MAEGHDYFSATGLSVSPDNTLLAYGVDTVSRRKYTIHFKDLGTGEVHSDAILNTTGRAVWANDNRTVFYARKDEALRPFKIFKHVLGTDPAADPEIFHEADNTYNTYVSKTKSDEYRIAMLPVGVEELISRGHTVIVEAGAGLRPKSLAALSYMIF